MGKDSPLRGEGDEAPVAGTTGVARPCLFISYRRSELVRVEPVVRAIEAAGIDCIFDQDAIDPLADFPDRIRHGIGASHGVFAWWSTDYARSDHCMAEFKLAWQHARRLSSDVGRRVWVLNPEAGADHIAAGELASQNFLAPPAEGAMDAWVEPLRTRLCALLPEGPLASERQPVVTPELRNVPHPTVTFTGRNAELMRIHSKLHPARIGAADAAVAVQTHGLGGIGKTELAAKYARDFAHAYEGGIYWLNFAGFAPDGPVSETDAHNAWLLALQQTFAGEIEILRDAEGRPLPARELRVALERRLGAAPYLWVLDNVPEMSPLDRRAAVLAFWRAPGAAGRTLITTRDSRGADGFAEERLDVLSEEDALRLLARFRWLGEDERGAALELIEEVGAHTLALHLLGEQLREAPGGYKGALAKLRETGRLDRIDALARQLQPLLGEKARGILATFDVSIAALDVNAQVLLGAAAVCAPNESIPVTLLAAVLQDEDRFASALSRLLRASLLTQRGERAQAGEPVEIHRLVADAAVQLLAVPAEELAEALGQCLIKLADTPDSVLTHDRALSDAMRQAKYFARRLQSQTGVRLGLWLASHQFVRGLYPLAHAAGEQALALATRVLGERHPDTLRSMNNLAGTLYAQGDLAGARALQEQVLAISREVPTEGHLDTLAGTNNLAETLRAQGDLAGARTLQEQVVAEIGDALGEQHPYTLLSVNNLAETLYAQGDLAGARTLQEQVVAGYCETLGEWHPDTLAVMNKLTATLYDQGDLAGARALEEKVLAIRRELLGERHPDTLTIMSNLAETCRALGDLAGARTLQKQVLATRRDVLGERHPETTVSAWNLFNTLSRLEATQQAARVRDDHLVWLLGAAAENLDGQQRQIRDWLRDLADAGRQRSWPQRIATWLYRRLQ